MSDRTESLPQRVRRLERENRLLRAKLASRESPPERSIPSLEELFELGPDGVLLLDQEGVILLANPAAASLWNLRPGDLKGAVLGIPAVAGSRWEFDVVCSGRSDRVLEAHTAEFHWQGRELVVVFLRDISDRIAAEACQRHLIDELESKNHEMERFTSVVSHDLRGPLVTIQGHLGRLRREIKRGKTGEIDRRADRIAGAAEKMQDLLAGLLRLSRSGQRANPVERVDLGQTVQEVLELLAGPIQKRQARISVAPSMPEVFGDRLCLREVFQNLIENALKFSGCQKHPQIEIGWKPGDDDQALLFVRDHGIGIEPEHRHTVFELFSQLDPGAGGVGVGLSLVRKLVRAHGGDAWVDSAGRGEGTTVWMRLPMLGVFEPSDGTG